MSTDGPGVRPGRRSTVAPVDLRFWSRALSAFARHARNKQFLGEVLTAGIKADIAPRAVGKGMLKAFPEIRGRVVPMGDTLYSRWNMDPLEQFFLAALAGVRQPRTIFEIGTFDGATTLLLARAAPQARISTLDLPPETLADPESLYSQAREKAGSWGSRFHGTPEENRITQLFCDSREFDFSPYYGKMDLVVVDGSHDADCVTSDTENALRMVAEGGVVIWDDYEPGWVSVTRSVDDVAARHGLSLVHIRKTGLAVYDGADPSSDGGVVASTRTRAVGSVPG
jgi:predicted O-methyltransferase YrrM